jgi:DNA-binding GntR family transcriptional regulator
MDTVGLDRAPKSAHRYTIVPMTDPRSAGFVASSSVPDRTHAVYAAVRQAIMENALVPGTKLPEDALGANFGVSRTIVRAALARLTTEGLVETGKAKSAMVASPSPEEAKATFAVRRCLEREAVRWISDRWQPEMRAVLEQHVELERDAAGTGNPKLSGRLAAEFHILVAEQTGNPLMHRYVSETVSRCGLILAVYGRDHSQDSSIREHTALIAAMADRDADAAEQLMDAHIVAVEERAMPPARIESTPDLSQILRTYATARP